ncbi:MAG: methyltransferase domain-containing protein [Cyanobacteria bacterium P01_A01_bin.37]
MTINRDQASHDNLFERFIMPVFGNLLLDQEALMRYRNSIDWDTACDRFQSDSVDYPDYYKNQNFHGVQNGYLSINAAVTYDPITRYAVPPHEEWVRQGVIDHVKGHPRRILDLGCGTGSTTLLLKKAYPNAEVIGLDLSPFMLVIADQKAQQANLSVEFCQGNAEATGFSDESFDLVTASLLFHETPPAIAQNILYDCFRLLKPGGEVIILDGDQSVLRQTAWLTEIFEEPYIKAYASGSTDAWMGRAGFDAIRTENWWGVHQITTAIKPLRINAPTRVTFDSPTPDSDGEQWVMG